MKIKYPDYSNCIANLACSLLQYYGITPPNATLSVADELLQKEYKNVLLLLLDGMGVNILEKHLAEDGFFRRNRRCSYSSTFPPTTVAATTAVDSGLFPNQSAWLGWTGYFPQIDRNIIYFWSVDNDTGEKIEEYHVAREFVPYTSIREQIAETGVATHYLAPFIEPHPKSYDLFCKEIKKLCDSDGKKFIYAYWDEPDYSMHDNGIDGEIIRRLVTDLEARTEELVAGLEDTLVLITADHGHINIKNESLTDYPDIMECLVRMPSMEVRALNLFVKEGMHQQFEKVFEKHFNGKFMLISKEEILNRQLLGCGESHTQLDGMLGDYLAVAVDDTAIGNVPGGHAGNHAGLTEEEMIIPLIAIEKK